MTSTGIERFRQEAKLIKNYFPSLDYKDNDIPTIWGDITLYADGNQILDRYSVKIVAVEEYPKRFPLVFETAGRIPINIDWHVFPDGHCCLMPIPQEILTCTKALTLASFINNEVVPYFWNQKHRELHGFFLNERSHGVEGTIEFFQDKLNTPSRALTKQFLNFIATGNEPKNTDKCFCGSGSKYKKCHRATFRELSQLSEKMLLFYADLL